VAIHGLVIRQRLARTAAQGGVTLADREPGLCRNAKAGFIVFLARASFPAGFFFNFSESAQTPSHMPFLREPPCWQATP
jgi:hypothetical protein